MPIQNLSINTYKYITNFLILKLMVTVSCESYVVIFQHRNICQRSSLYEIYDLLFVKYVYIVMVFLNYLWWTN